MSTSLPASYISLSTTFLHVVLRMLATRWKLLAVMRFFFSLPEPGFPISTCEVPHSESFILTKRQLVDSGLLLLLVQIRVGLRAVRSGAVGSVIRVGRSQQPPAHAAAAPVSRGTVPHTLFRFHKLFESA